jgi:hypothetical protein
MSIIEQFDGQLRCRGHAGTPDANAVLMAADAALQAAGDFHRLFDVRLMLVRQKLGLPVTQPTSLRDIPKAVEPEFRKAYADTAREIGELFLKAGRLPDAWAYFRSIQEPEPVRQAIAAKIESLEEASGPEVEELLNLALYDQAHVVAGLKLLLRMNGTCNTITAIGQLLSQMKPDERRQAAALMVRTIHTDLLANVRRDVERRQPVLRPGSTLRELVAGRESLFEGGAYHIDVSHLHSTVSFARHLHADDAELPLAIDLCYYGTQLAEPLRYPADVPFDDYYTASLHFLTALQGPSVNEGLQYFAARLRDEPDAADQRMIAFVLTDLASRVGRLAEVIEQVAPHLAGMDDPNGFSFTACCVEAGRLDLLESVARQKDDVLALATAMLLKSPQSAPAHSGAAT